MHFSLSNKYSSTNVAASVAASIYFLFFTATPARARPLIIRPVNRPQIVRHYGNVCHEIRYSNDTNVAHHNSLPFHAVTILSSRLGNGVCDLASYNISQASFIYFCVSSTLSLKWLAVSSIDDSIQSTFLPVSSP